MVLRPGQLQAARGGIPAVLGLLAAAVSLAGCGDADTPAKEDIVPPAPTAFVCPDAGLRHETRPGHPERPDRLRAIRTALDEAELPGELLRLSAEPAETKWIEAVHDSDYVERVQRVCRAGGGLLDAGDTPAGTQIGRASCRERVCHRV